MYLYVPCKSLIFTLQSSSLFLLDMKIGLFGDRLDTIGMYRSVIIIRDVVLQDRWCLNCGSGLSRKVLPCSLFEVTI